MSEGLLKKRIRELGYGEISQDGTPYIDIKLLFRSDIDKILDEAKNSLNEIIDEIEFNSEPEDKIDGLYAKMVLARLKTYRKVWFGSAGGEVVLPKKKKTKKPSELKLIRTKMGKLAYKELMRAYEENKTRKKPLIIHF